MIIVRGGEREEEREGENVLFCLIIPEIYNQKI